MTKVSKFIYITIIIISIAALVARLINKEYDRAGDGFAITCWICVAFMNELRCIKLKKQIDKLDGNN